MSFWFSGSLDSLVPFFLFFSCLSPILSSQFLSLLKGCEGMQSAEQQPAAPAVDLLLPLNRLPTCTDCAPDAGYDELRLLIFHSSHTISSSRVSLPVTPLSPRLAPHQ